MMLRHEYLVWEMLPEGVRAHDPVGTHRLPGLAKRGFRSASREECLRWIEDLGEAGADYEIRAVIRKE